MNNLELTYTARYMCFCKVMHSFQVKGIASGNLWNLIL